MHTHFEFIVQTFQVFLQSPDLILGTGGLLSFCSQLSLVAAVAQLNTFLQLLQTHANTKSKHNLLQNVKEWADLHIYKKKCTLILRSASSARVFSSSSLRLSSSLVPNSLLSTSFFSRAMVA